MKKFFTVIFVMAGFLLFQNEARAAVSFVSSGTIANVTSGGGNLVGVGIPAEIASNDILIVVLHSRDNVVSTMPVDWTLKVSGNGNGTNRLSVWWKRTTGTESAPTITHTGGSFAIARMYAFSGVITSGDPFDAVGAVQSNAGSPISTTAVTTTLNGDMILHAFGSQDKNTWGTFTGVPTIDTGAQANTPANSDSMDLTYGLQGTAGSTGAAGATQASAGPDAGVSVQMALKPADVAAPTPNPMTFATMPTNDNAVQISMTSTIGSDATTPVNYLFTNDNSACGGSAGTGGTTGSWQSSTSYSDSGLQANKCYGYTIQARDSVTPTPNTGTASAISSTYTSANTPGAPTLSGATASTLVLTNAENGNSASSPTTYFAVQVVTTSDANWLNKWVDASGNPSTGAVWLSDAQLDGLVLHSLQSSTLYGVRVTARNNDTDESAPSIEGQGTTLAPTITVTNYTNTTETALNYAGSCTSCGARIGGGASFRQTVTITGTNLGTITAGNRSTASNNIKVGTHQIADANVTVWTPTTITFLTDSATAGDADSDWGTNFGGASALVVTAGSQTATGLNFYVFPQITSVTQPSGFPADSAREYDAGDTDGIVTLNGTRFGTAQGAGSVTTVSQTASPTSWGNTAITVQVPTAIVDTTNTGAISMAQGTGSNGKTHTYANTFRVLPRITSFSPTSGNEGMAVTVNGNHFCQSGTCPGSLSAANKVTFTSGVIATTFTSWSATAIVTAVPTGAVTGNIVVTSNTSYTSNAKSFTVTANTTTLGDSSDPSPTSLAPGGVATMADAFTFVTNGGTDPITAVVVGLATGTAEGLDLVEITDSTGGTVYGSVVSPGNDTPSIPLSGLTATTISTIYKIRITPRIHTAMPPPPGSTYLVTAKINSWSGANATAGSDTAGTTITIDNLSPAGTTNASATQGENARSTVSWTNPGGDFQKVIIYCKTASITETPTEGTDPSADGTACDGTARVKYNGSASPQSFTGLANGTTYYFRIFARDLNGNFTAIASTQQVSATPSLTPITTLGNFVTGEPSDSGIAPGTSGSVDSFSLQTNTGTDTVTGATVTLASGMGQHIQTVAITNNDGSHTYCSSSPSGDIATLTSCGIPVNTTGTQFKVKITASVSMPAPPGGSYAVTGRVTAFTSTNTQSLNDSGSATVTIDNASPNGATLVSGSAGNASATLNWTTSNSSDFNTASGSVILRWAAYSAGSEVPAEGSTFSAGNTIGGTATVACVISSSLSTALSKIDGTGGSVGCTTAALTNGQAYTYKVFQKDLSGNYDTGVLMGTFQPALSTFLMTASAGAGGTISPTGTSTVAQGSSITYTITPNLGYDVATVTDNGFTQATTTSYSINGVAMDHTVTVTFVMVTPTYTITSSAGEHGTISPLGTTIFLQGASQIYTITPISGFAVDTLIVDGSPKATSTSYTFTDIRVNSTINATFAAIPPPPGSFNITASAGANGTVSPNGVTAVAQGNSQAYTITPNSGYNIATLTVDSVSIATSTSYTFTDIQTNHTINATFVEISGTTTTVPDTGASRPTTVTFSGKAFPGGKVSVINKTLNTEKLTGQENVAGDDGSFSISFVGILQGLQSFGLIAKDKDQRTAQTKFFFVDTTSESFTTKNILVPPTIDIANGQVSRGGNATIFGYATPGYSIRLYLDDILMEEISVEQSGLYKFEVPTGALDFGQHKVKTKQVRPLEKKESDFSTTRTFIVSRLSVVKADLSGDGKVDIRDWSIFLSRWGAKGSLGRENIDFNGDGKVDITDFSIFIKTIRKK